MLLLLVRVFDVFVSCTTTTTTYNTLLFFYGELLNNNSKGIYHSQNTQSTMESKVHVWYFRSMFGNQQLVSLMCVTGICDSAHECPQDSVSSG